MSLYLMHLLLIYPIFILSISNNASLSDILVKFLIATLADPCRVGKPGSKLAQFERDTWPELNRLASNVPEAGVHFQGKNVIDCNY